MYVYNAFASSSSITNSVSWSVEHTHLKSAMAETSSGYVTMASLGFSFEQLNKEIKQAPAQSKQKTNPPQTLLKRKGRVVFTQCH